MGGKMEPIRNLNDIEKMEHILRQYSYRDWFAFKLGINSALRAGDMLKLRVYDMRNRYLDLKESKTRKYRRFYINSSLKPVIQDYIRHMNDEDYLFRLPTRNRPITVEALYQRLRRAADRIGLTNIGTHSMRKTFAYHFYKRFSDEQGLVKLMMILNHAEAKETLIYIGIMQEEIDSSIKEFYL